MKDSLKPPSYSSSLRSFWSKKLKLVTQSSTPLLLTLSGLFLLTALVGLIWVAQEVNKLSFDTRQQASVADGSVRITSSMAGQVIPLGQNKRIPIEIETTSEAVVGVQLKFNTITNGTIQTPRIVENAGDTSIPGYDMQFPAPTQAFKPVADGFWSNLFFTSAVSIDTPIYTSTGLSLKGKPVPQSARTLFYVEFDAVANGTLELNFDVESSLAPGAIGSVSQGQDLLKHVGVMTFTIGEPPATPTPSSTPTETPAPTPQTTITAVPTTTTSPAPTTTTSPAPTTTTSPAPTTTTSPAPTTTTSPAPTTTTSPAPTTTTSPAPTTTTSPAPTTTTSPAPTTTTSPAPTTTTSPAPTTTTSPVDTRTDDFSFILLEDRHRQFTFYKTDTNQQVRPEDMESGKQYKVVHTSYIQNTNKNATTDYTGIQLQFKAKNAALVTQSIARADMAKLSGPLAATFEVTFVANTENEFSLTLDPNNSYAETKEDNNTWTSIVFRTKDYSGTGGVTVTYKQCNEVCSSNSECAPGFRCFDTGSDKRCRLINYVSSTSCENASVNAQGRSCNEYCANSNDCRSGLTCWYNRCRQPFNVESTSCVALSTTQQSSSVAQNCNVACSTNKDCAVNFRCYNGSCRLATNPVSAVCAAPQVSTTGSTGKGSTPTSGSSTTGTKTVTPTPTTKVTVTPSSKPGSATSSATASGSAIARISPVPTTAIVTAAPTEGTTDSNSNTTVKEVTALDAVRNSINGWLNSLTAGDSNMSLLLWVLLAGVGLFLIAILFFILRKGKSQQNIYRPPTQAMKSTNPQNSVGASSTDVHKAEMSVMSAGKQSTITSPATQPLSSTAVTASTNTATATPGTSTITRPPSSMLNRIKEKDIHPPAGS